MKDHSIRFSKVVDRSVNRPSVRAPHFNVKCRKDYRYFLNRPASYLRYPNQVSPPQIMFFFRKSNWKDNVSSPPILSAVRCWLLPYPSKVPPRDREKDRFGPDDTKYSHVLMQSSRSLALYSHLLVLWYYYSLVEPSPFLKNHVYAL